MSFRRRSIFFSLILILGVLIACEMLMTVVYFHSTSKHASALVVYSKDLLQIGIRRFFPIGIFEDDPVLGYRHKRDIVGTHLDLDFSVSYTLGPNGSRVIPEPSHSRGRIVFVGGSYTFGHGVEDSETFPALLARDYWPEWTVKNRAVAGYGTAHAYLNLKQELDGDSPPEAIVYPFLNGHIVRNYISEEWLGAISIFGRHHPHFEIESGQLSYLGIVGVEESKAKGVATAEMERDLTILLIKEMQRLCRERGVAFFVILLPGEKWPPAVAASLYQLDHTPLDLSAYRLKGFANDGHPNSADQRYFAEQIGQSAINQWVESFSRDSEFGAE